MLPGNRLSLKVNAKKAVEIVIYQLEYKYNGNEIADNKIKKLIKWDNPIIVNNLIRALKISNQALAKFLPNYIIEITQEGKILFSILTNHNHIKCGGLIYKSVIDIDKYLQGLILKYK